MKQYICRLRNYEGFIVDGLFVTARNKKEALNEYLRLHPFAKTDKTKTDYYTVEEYEA